MTVISPHLPLWRLGADLAKSDSKNDRITIKRMMGAKKRHYRFGWNAADNGEPRERAEESYLIRHGGVFMQDWLDGYEDREQGRGMGHLMQCPGHSSGGCDPSKSLPGILDFT